MDPELWKKVKEVYSAARELEPAARESHLAETCSRDAALLREVQSLLAQDSRIQDPLQTPAMEVAARALASEKSANPQSSLAGQRILHFRLEEKIGEGGMGVVHRAWDEKLRRVVAIKTLPHELVADPERKKRFVKEARTASALNHPNIVTVHEIISDGERDFIVMEYVDGKTLDLKIAGKAIGYGDILRFAIQIADALTAAHSAGIVHRDLKPANVLVTESGLVKVLDFGLAKLTEREAQPAMDASTALVTAEGRIMGTAAYMSPEQAEGKPVDERSDVFSFGGVLYEMATGRRPFKGSSSMATISAILSRDPDPIGRHVPSGFAKLVERCMRKDPFRRAQHMGDVKVALEDLKADADAERLRTAWRGKRLVPPIALWLIASGLLLATLLSIAYFREKARNTVDFNVIPLTNSPGFQNSPTFSPDGSRVALTWNEDKPGYEHVFIMQIGSGTPRRLTSNPRPEFSPAWSPDGSWIAFVRDQVIYIIPPEGGPERKLTEGTMPSWAPDGKTLVYRTIGPGITTFHLYMVSIDTGDKIGPLTSPLPQSPGDSQPVFSPDGLHLAFLRVPRATPTATDIYILPFTNGRPGGEPWRLTLDNCRVSGMSWTRDSQEIVFSSARGGRIGLWRMRAVPGSKAERLPGTDDAAALAISRGAPSRLAFARRLLRESIWRMKIATGGSTSPERITSSTGQDVGPQFSPDGTKMAFSSNRSGFEEIMVSSSDGSGLVSVTNLKGARGVGAPRWSPDGQKLAFDSQDPQGVNVMVCDAQGGGLRPVTQDGWSNFRPSWSHDGKWIYFGSNRSGMNQIWKAYPGGENLQQVTRNGGLEAFESPDGKTLYYTRGGFRGVGLWSLPLEGGPGTEIPELSKLPASWWGVFDRGIVFIDPNDPALVSRMPVKIYDFQNRQVVQAGLVEKFMGQTLGVSSFSVSRDGRWIAWRQQDRDEANLMLIEDFR
jgi:eukaryotic-like serine/threonine-protein kinase